MTEESPRLPQRSLVRAFIWSAIIGLAVFAGVFAAMKMNSPHGEPLTPMDQRPPTGLKMDKLGGGSWSLEEAKGQVVVVNYFATWCGPCAEEMPDMVKIAGEYGSKGVRVAGVNLDEPGPDREAILRPFLQRYGVNYLVLLPGRDSPLFRAEMPIPQTYLIDRNGRVAKKIIGKTTAAELRGDLDELLKEPGPSNQEKSEP